MEQKLDRHRFYLLTYPRTASNLLIRILSLEKQPNAVTDTQREYFFLKTMFLAEQLQLSKKSAEEWSDEERQKMMDSYQQCFEVLEGHVRKAEADGKIAFVKEHVNLMVEPILRSSMVHGNTITKPPFVVQIPSSYGPATRSNLNDTIMPDQFMKTWLPIFLIRHPGLAFPSLFRASLEMDKEGALNRTEAQDSSRMTLRWSRHLYDWYLQNLNEADKAYTNEVSSDSDKIEWPLVIDADDIINEPEVIIRLCEIVGLDANQLQYAWAPATAEEVAAKYSSPSHQRMMSTLLASDGIVKNKTWEGLDIDSEAKKWRAEFGEEKGGMMERLVRKAMPDYEYMLAKRLRPKQKNAQV
jgi:hypothetical protein